MRKVLLWAGIILSFAVLGRAEGANFPVMKIIVDEGIAVFCISSESLSDIPVEGQQYVQYFDEPDQIDEVLLSLLNQKAYNAFLNEYERTGYAETEVYQPSLANVENGELGSWISERSINKNWVLAYHSLSEDADMYTATMSVMKITLKYEGGVLVRTYEGSAKLEIQPNEYRSNPEDLELVNQKDGTTVALYALEGGAVAFIAEIEGRANCVMNACIADDTIDQVVGVEQSDGKVVFVCPLEQSEVNQVRFGDRFWITEQTP